MIGGDGFCGIIKGRQVIARRVLVATGLTRVACCLL
jgi:hypothetical protein